MKWLENIIKGVGIVTAAGIVGLSAPSCESMDLVSVLFDTVASNEKATPGQRRDAAYLSKWAEKLGDRQAQERIAQENKSEVNVIVNEKSDDLEKIAVDEYYPPAKVLEKFNGIIPPASFTSLGYGDLDNNGIITRNEIQLKNTFNCERGINVICGSSWYNAQGKNIAVKISDAKTGDIIGVHDVGQAGADGSIKSVYIPFSKKDNKGIKEYLVKWLVDGKFMPNRESVFYVNYDSAEKTLQYAPEIKDETNKKKLIIPEMDYNRAGKDRISFDSYREWDDKNDNNIIEDRELKDLNEKLFYLVQKDFHLCFASDKAGYLKFKTWKILPKESLEEVTEKEVYYPGKRKAVTISLNTEDKSLGNIVRSIYSNGFGKYRISAYLECEDGSKESKDIDVRFLK